MVPRDLPEKRPGSDRRTPQRGHQAPSDLERKVESHICHLLSATNALSVMLMTSNHSAPPVKQQNQASESTSQAAHPKPQADDTSSFSMSFNYRKLTDLSSPAAQPKPQTEVASLLSVSSNQAHFEDTLSSSASSKHRRLSDTPIAYPKPQAQDATSSSLSSKHRLSASKSPEAKSRSQAEDGSSSPVSSKQWHSGISASPTAQLQPHAEDASPSKISSKHWKRSSPTKRSQKHKQPRRAQTRQPPATQKPLPALSLCRSFNPVRTFFLSKGINFIKKRQEQQERELQKEQELIDKALNQSTDTTRADNPSHMLPGQLLINNLQLKSTILRLEVLKTESGLQ